MFVCCVLGLAQGGLDGCHPFPLCGEDNTALESFSLFKTLKLVRLLRLVRLTKLVKLVTSAAVKELVPENLLLILTVLFKILYFAHFLACIWFWISGITERDRIPNCDYQDGNGSVVCVEHTDQSMYGDGTITIACHGTVALCRVCFAYVKLHSSSCRL